MTDHSTMMIALLIALLLQYGAVCFVAGLQFAKWAYTRERP